MADFAILSPQITRGLSDKLYDKRKNAALEVERIVREYVINNETTRIRLIIDVLVQDFVYSVSPNARNGGLIGLAATSISLGPHVSTYLDIIVQPVVTCFADPDSRVRYYACESMYNIAKVARGSILRYFNELFDSLSKLYADTEESVKNGAELLDRLIKDIVHEQSIAYSGAITHIGDQDPQQLALEMPRESQFSLPRFIPLLRERVYAQNPFTRNYLVTWIAVLDSIPDLELVSYLPDFLDGLLYFLSDPTHDVRTLTQTLLNNFLSEIREIAELQQHQQELQRIKQLRLAESQKSAMITSGTATEASLSSSPVPPIKDLLEAESTGQGKGNWVPGQGVVIEYAEIVKILKPHLTSSDEDIQETALRWINEFIELAKDVMIEFIPVLIPAILPCLAHSVTSIRTIANETNLSLYKLVYESPLPVPPAPPATAAPPPAAAALSAVLERATSPRPHSPRGQERLGTSSSIASKLASATSREQASTGRDSESSSTAMTAITATEVMVPDKQQERKAAASKEPFDYTRTVHALTLQFLNEHEQTRVASLEWLLMLHKRAPHLILVEDDGSFPILLKTLSDPSEEVIKRDLQLLAQISSYSDDAYFTNFMFNLLNLFGTDRRLLETRGSVIIRQLCVSLNSEKIYRTLAELIEKEDELDFANTMVQNLNIILITAPELADLRRKLRNADSREGQALFTVLYKSWCHNPVSTFALCLMAQYYEHAVALLQSFVEFEITVNLLIQVDKLVQLIESPVFTYLRLQLLEPDRYPHLFKCLYGLLMLLPQSTAFATLRNRLTSVSSMGFIHLVPKLPQGNQAGSTPYSSGRIKGSSSSTLQSYQNDSSSNSYGSSGSSGGSGGPKFQELLAHFRAVQSRHERARRGTIQNMMRDSAYGTNNHLKAAAANMHGGGGGHHLYQQQQQSHHHPQHSQHSDGHHHQQQQRQLSYAQQHDTYGNTGYHDVSGVTHRSSVYSSSPNGTGTTAVGAGGSARRRTRDSRLEPPSSLLTSSTGGGGGGTSTGSPNAGPTGTGGPPGSRASYQGPKPGGGGQVGNSALSPSSSASPSSDQELPKK